MSELSELLDEGRRRKEWTKRQVGREARARGFQLSDATATAYLGGRHGIPDDTTITAFATTLGIPERLIRKAANLRAPGEPWDPPEGSRYLREDQRIALDQLILTMIEREAGTGHVAKPAQKRLQRGHGITLSDDE